MTVIGRLLDKDVVLKVFLDVTVLNTQLCWDVALSLLDFNIE